MIALGRGRWLIHVGVSRENYTLYVAGQKQGMTELKFIWPVILTGDQVAIISSPDTNARKFVIFLTIFNSL